jgi:hypothetical protein
MLRIAFCSFLLNDMIINEQVAAVALMLKAVDGSEVWLRGGKIIREDRPSCGHSESSICNRHKRRMMSVTTYEKNGGVIAVTAPSPFKRGQLRSSSNDQHRGRHRSRAKHGLAEC